MGEFASLTDAGRSRRLARLAKTALLDYDLDVTRIRLVAGAFNVIYRLQVANEPPHLLRIGWSRRLHLPDVDTVAAAWQLALRADLALPVARYVPARDGRIVRPVRSDGVPESRQCAVLTWVPGRAVGQGVTIEQAAACGRLLAQLHEHASTWSVPDVLQVPMANRVSYLGEESLLDTLGRHKALYLEAQDRAQETIDAIWRHETKPPHVLHGDLTINNTVVNRSGLVPIDFQDLTVGHEVQDIAIALLPLSRLAAGEALIEGFRAGYQERRTWPDYGPETMEALFAARRVQMANVSLHLRRVDMDDYLDRSATILARWMGIGPARPSRPGRGRLPCAQPFEGSR